MTNVCLMIGIVLRPIVNSAMMSTLTVHCQRDDGVGRERTGH